MSKQAKLSPWRKANWALLQSYVALDRIPQALLITGPTGLGAADLARDFAFSLLCKQPDKEGFHCDRCDSCLLIQAESHPDFAEINPEEDKKNISINQIRTVVANTSLKPQYDKYRVIIINPAELMTISASNAFLKCLEEPGERTIFILVTGRPHQLPATVISRCQQIKLAYPERHELQEQLKTQELPGKSEALVSLLTYSILTINQLSDNKLFKQRDDCLNDWLSLAKMESYPTVIAEKWQKIAETDLFNWLYSWISDLIKCRLDCSTGYLCNLDKSEAFQVLARQQDLPELHNLYKLILNGRSLLGGQLNQQLMLEEILIQWQQINRSKQRWQKPLPDKG
jgi:DNA polymerase III subunit delta'